jgi:hypothetical protein
LIDLPYITHLQAAKQAAKKARFAFDTTGFDILFSFDYAQDALNKRDFYSVNLSYRIHISEAGILIL